MAPRRLRTVLVAPSRYDEKGVLVFRVGINQNGSHRGFTFTDDDFLRNPRHPEIPEGVAKIREDSPRGERTQRFLALCREAGVSNVFMGLESTNDASLQRMAKQVNRDPR